MKYASPLLFIVAGAAIATNAPADSPTTSASASAMPVASSSATQPLSDAAPLEPYKDWPKEPSAKPKAEEWTGAQRLPLLRPSKFCEASRIREWLRLSCHVVRPEGGHWRKWTGPVELKGIRVVGGSAADVSIEDRPPDPDQKLVDQWGGRVPHGIVVTLPVRPSDRRLIEVVEPWMEGKYSSGETAAVMLSALWLPSEPGPTIVID